MVDQVGSKICNSKHCCNHCQKQSLLLGADRRMLESRQIRRRSSLKTFSPVYVICSMPLCQGEGVQQFDEFLRQFINASMSLLPLVLASFFLVGQVVVVKKSKLSQTHRVTYQNLCEKGTKPMIKTRAQSGLPVKRKIQKTTQNTTFLKNCIFGCYFGFFS